MKMPADQVERIIALGYTEPEARFLYLVATHSGYFTRRQFLAYTDACPGKRSTRFSQKLLNRGHATVRDYMGTGSVFHLFSRRLYGPIGKEDLRNRHRHSFDHIRTRLVLLDFLLENLEHEFLETEQDKVRFFCESLGIQKEALPAKVYEGSPESRPTVRFFADNFPLFLAFPSPELPPLVTFSYVDSKCASLSSLGAHLGAYQTLFRQLNSFRFLYVAPSPKQFGRAEVRFRTFMKTKLDSDASSEILRYFDIRRKWERHEYVVPITEDLEFLGEARRRFHGERIESLYLAWCAGQLAEGDLRLEFQQGTADRTVVFDTYLVSHGRSPLDEKHRTG